MIRLVHLVQVAQVVRVVSLDNMRSEIFGLHIKSLRKLRDVMPVTDARKCESRAIFRVGSWITMMKIMTVTFLPSW